MSAAHKLASPLAVWGRLVACAGLSIPLRLFSFWRHLCTDEAGQDLIEYALICATLAVVVAGFLPPTVMPAVSTIFSKISSSMAIS